MTKQEALYWKKFIIETIETRLPLYRPSDEDAKKISEFAESYMPVIVGQEYLPQSVFRQFLRIFSNIPAIQEEIKRAQEQLAAWLENMPDECTKKEVEQIFDGEMLEDGSMYLPSMDVDEDGDVQLNIVVDEFGNATFVND